MVRSTSLIPVTLALIVSLLFTAGYCIAADEEVVVRLSEPVQESSDFETFGSPMDTDDGVPAVTLAQLADAGDEYLATPVRVTARVGQVCQKKGCFLIVQDGDTVMRVSFKDYGFFVPTDIGGKRVMLVGELVGRELTVEQVEHYAEDLGTSAAKLQPGKTYEIVATSVRIPRD